MDYQVESRTVPEQPTAVVRASLPAEQVGDWLSHAYQDVAGYLNRVGAMMTGPPIARLTFRERVMDIEAGFPVAEPVSGEGRVVPSSLPPGPVAVTTHHGRYEEVSQAHQAVLRWLRDNGHRERGPHWEVYYTDPMAEPDPARWRTDVVVPFDGG